MTAYIEYDLGDGASILIEAPEDEAGEVVKASREKDEVAKVKAKLSFTEALKDVCTQAKLFLKEVDELQVSEAEINFLTSFHLRFRKAVQELRGGDDAPPAADAQPSAEPAADPAGAGRGVDGEETSEPTAAATEASDVEEPTGAKRREPKERPPMRLASPATDKEAATAAAKPDAETIEMVEDVEQPPDEPDERVVRETTATILKRAMEKGENQVVLRELYREVTGIAEVIWSTDEIPTTAVWDRVSTNKWYESNFSKLELRPLSDFYELISQVRQKRKSGAAKADIQSFLNDSRFATILLALRDMFQRNDI